MKFSVQRDSLNQALSMVTGIVERRQTYPILANVLLVIEGQTLSLTGTDLELQVTTQLLIDEPLSEPLRLTLPAKKLSDICKALPEHSEIRFQSSDAGQKFLVQCGKSRFTLATLPADEFPNVEMGENTVNFSMSQGQLKSLIDKTGFAMGQQDVRFYLNGLLLEIDQGVLKAVATDGHRLAFAQQVCDLPDIEKTQIILPRKAVLELSRTLSSTDDVVQLAFGRNHFYISNPTFTFVSKLIDGKFPDYSRVIPQNSMYQLLADRTELKETFSRAAILSNDKFRGAQLTLSPNTLTIQASNTEREEVEDSVVVDYQGEALAIGFNINYLIDVMNIIDHDQVKLSLMDANSSALIQSAADEHSMYVVMPMKL